MPAQFVQYINQYGYLAIFVLILIQEIGIPTPLPNEILMLFSGYLISTSVLKYYWVLLTIISADVLGANILYTIFYYFGPAIIRGKPKWFPLSTEKINRISAKVQSGGLWTIFLGRITPLIRGYISVIVGLLHIQPKKYVLVTIITGAIVSTCWVTIGTILGQYWVVVAAKLGMIKYVLLAVVLIIVLVMIIKYYRRKNKKTVLPLPRE